MKDVNRVDEFEYSNDELLDVSLSHYDDFSRWDLPTERLERILSMNFQLANGGDSKALCLCGRVVAARLRWWLKHNELLMFAAGFGRPNCALDSSDDEDVAADSYDDE